MKYIIIGDGEYVDIQDEEKMYSPIVEGIWKEDAIRFVTCWNYCENIPTEDLQQMLEGGYNLFNRFMLMDRLIYQIDGFSGLYTKVSEELIKLQEQYQYEVQNFKNTGDMWDESWRKSNGIQ